MAEGQARGTKEFRHFLRITLGSLAELETQLMIARNLRMVREEVTVPIAEEITSLRKQTFSLIKNL
ncbi:MAG: four helix bundle protein [Saprospirales bacterium]|nr:MAG: four helix bundle protein [Saprospirales bacterium]